MSWTMILAWPEICTEAHEYDEDAAMKANPELLSSAWAATIAGLMIDDALQDRIRQAGCGPLIAHSSEGMEADAIGWVSPTELATAASVLQQLIRHDDPLAREIVELFTDYSVEPEDPPAEILIDDLEEIADAARQAAASGHRRVTLEIQY